ncbi:ClpXP protease specificity-enhancing factor [Marinomonas sp. C2222]|uniref:ClpXP protease specificity-enhancing factor n=1 Tax=Marinomonas sargassi TaxID=2984494 RepID=A0ABT2YT26_9GAMM|nr:ClpXP protease specificity-enhancing factor [Marinomonas sargassi]MCV2403041.1 ClpXP protease specificity-enhancing factor [Marinomonas sargassi]
MLPKRSYLLNATYEWISDNDMTPYLLVNAEEEGTVIPTEFVQDGQIVLNVSMSAVRHLIMDKDGVSFEARFSGKPMQVFVPIKAAIALYAKENGDGLVFPEEDFSASSNPPPPPEPPKPQKGFQLKVVK